MDYADLSHSMLVSAGTFCDSCAQGHDKRITLYNHTVILWQLNQEGCNEQDIKKNTHTEMKTRNT
jgi:hypothetical protein